MNQRHLVSLVACLLAATVSGSASAETIYGIAAVGNATNLVQFDSSSPSNLQSASFVTGLQSNETIVGLDFRPATGQLYGLGSSSRLYTINPATGAATTVAGQLSTLLNGFSFGFDFNPNIDRIRVVSETNQNLVLNPNGAFQAAGTPVFYAAGDPNFGVDPNVVHAAYDRNVNLPSPATQLYSIDTGLNILAKQANSAGTLTTVGPLGFDPSSAGGFDISGLTGTAYAALLPAGGSQSSLYSINLLTGLATNLGVIDGGLVITALTIAPAPVPEPTTVALALAGVIGLMGLRAKR